MKMTRLEWRYLQRIALDHPYYDTHKPPLSDAEARAIMEANNTMTGREFVDSIYAKLGMTRPVKEKKRLAWLRDIGEFFAIPPIRKVAIAVLVVVLMTVFFAATPAGRAIAESVIQYFATLFSDGRLGVNQNDKDHLLLLTENKDYVGREEPDNSDDLENGVSIDSFDAFTRATGKAPIVLPLSYTELYYEYDEMVDYLVLYAFYETQGGEIITYQIWDTEDWVSSTSTGFIAFDMDETIYYSLEGQDKIVIKKINKDSIFTIVSKGSFALDDLINMLKHE